MSKIQRAAQYYVQQELKGMINHNIDSGDMERAFIAGVEWAQKNKAKSKAVCLRDKDKICNLCHECDVNVLNPNY
ncbi:hypothetical protein OCV73_00145 [Barnesiella propionica]|uniref:hypothetical protein n=1 Tax=Barnesiella propionica TaxID=2981781 RepID=UPI0011CBDC95|nr:hypothetical protein [Barnesiella propionica]MCU6767372.1 hypothetical protein [Barnesiella propionica]